MIIDFFGSLKDNIIKKVKNPFLGTFGIVFVLKNWQLFYSLLYFDASETRTSRIKIIEDYLTEHGGTWCIFGEAIVCTIMVLIISYSLALIGTYIGNFSDSIAVPHVIKWATKGAKIVTKESYDRLDLRCKKLEDQLKEEREKRFNAESDRDKAENNLMEYKKNNKPQDQLTVTNIDTGVNTTPKEMTKEKSKEEEIVDHIFENNWNNEFASIITKLVTSNVYESDIRNKDLRNFLFLWDIINISSNSSLLFLTDFGKKVKEVFAAETLHKDKRKEPPMEDFLL